MKNFIKKTNLFFFAFILLGVSFNVQAQSIGASWGGSYDILVTNNDLSNHWGQLRLQTGTSSAFTFSNFGNRMAVSFAAGSNFSDYSTNELFTVRNSGNVGIGFAGHEDITYKLQVRGDIYANGGWFRVSGDSGLYFESHGGGFYMTDNDWIRTYGNKNFYHNTGVMRTDGVLQVGPDGNRFLVTQGGNVGIGTTTPGFPLNFANANGDKISLYGQSGNIYGFGIQSNQLQIHTDASVSDVVFGHGSSANLTETMRIKGNGNVGIGTKTPGFPLTFAPVLGDKISLWGGSGNSYGFGIQNGVLQIHTDGSPSDVVFGHGSSANLTETMRIKGNGNVGIGTATPTVKLQVEAAGGSSHIQNTAFGDKGSDIYGGGYFVGARAQGTQTNRSAVKGGDSFALFVGKGYDGANYYSGAHIILGAAEDWSNTQHGSIITFGTKSLGSAANNSTPERMRITAEGNVGIGTTTPGSYKLAVEGKIGARQVDVKVSAWSDFVFEKDYTYKSLQEVESYINTHKHLPDVPSEATVLKEGIDLGKMDALLLQKIEELTLYLITQNKQIENQQKQIEQLLQSSKKNTKLTTKHGN